MEYLESSWDIYSKRRDMGFLRLSHDKKEISDYIEAGITSEDLKWLMQYSLSEQQESAIQDFKEWLYTANTIDTDPYRANITYRPFGKSREAKKDTLFFLDQEFMDLSVGGINQNTSNHLMEYVIDDHIQRLEGTALFYSTFRKSLSILEKEIGVKNLIFSEAPDDMNYDSFEINISADIPRRELTEKESLIISELEKKEQSIANLKNQEEVQPSKRTEAKSIIFPIEKEEILEKYSFLQNISAGDVLKIPKIFNAKDEIFSSEKITEAKQETALEEWEVDRVLTSVKSILPSICITKKSGEYEGFSKIVTDNLWARASAFNLKIGFQESIVKLDPTYRVSYPNNLTDSEIEDIVRKVNYFFEAEESMKTIVDVESTDEETVFVCKLIEIAGQEIDPFLSMRNTTSEIKEHIELIEASKIKISSEKGIQSVLDDVDTGEEIVGEPRKNL